MTAQIIVLFHPMPKALEILQKNINQQILVCELVKEIIGKTPSWQDDMKARGYKIL